MSTRTAARRASGHPATDPYVGATQVASQLGNTRNHAWKMMAEGVFGDVVDIASPGANKSQLRIRQSQLDAWIRSRTITNPAA